MASFVIHHVAGIEFLKRIEKEYNVYFTEEQKNQFLLGNLIVDSIKTNLHIPKGLDEEELAFLKKEYYQKIQEEKVKTHFRMMEDEEVFIQIPVVEKFVEKYQHIIQNDFSAMGYLFHLYTDKMFFCELFNENFECLDKNMQPTKYTKALRIIKVKKNGKLYSVNDVFNNEGKVSIYNDYTIMNKFLLDYYKIFFDYSGLYNYAKNNFINPGIEEVDYNNIFDVLIETDNYIKQSNDSKTCKLNVFSDNSVMLFIPNIVEKFLFEYFFLFKKNIVDMKKNTNIKKLEK